VLDEAVERGDADTAASARFFRAYVRGHASGGSFGELEREVREAIASLAGGGNDRTLAQGYLTLAWLLFWSGRIAEQVEAGQQGLVHARRAGDSSLEELLLRHLALGLAHGPARWTELERFATENRGQADRLGARLPSRMLVSLAAAAAHQGRLGEARTLAAEFRQGLEERGHTFALLSNVMVGAYIETLDGRPERAEAMLRASWDGLGELGERGFRSSIGVELAEALVALGRVDEALELLDEAEQMGSPDDWLNVAGAAEVRARAALARGEHERATDLAREAVEIADAYEYVDLRTELWLLYSDALVAAGQPVEARRALEETLRLAELKGSVVYGDPARALLMALPVPG